MADNANQQANIDQARELLSPYLDGEVTEVERRLVEQMIKTSPELRRDLETLRQTVVHISALPQVSAPRPFTLSEADVQPAPSAWKRFFTLPWIGGLAVSAAALLCVIVAGAIFWGGQFSPTSEVAMQEAPAAEEAAEEAGPPAGEVAKEATTVEFAAEAEAMEEAPAEEEAPVEEATEEEAAAEEPAAELLEPVEEAAGEEETAKDLRALEPATEDSTALTLEVVEEAEEEAMLDGVGEGAVTGEADTVTLLTRTVESRGDQDQVLAADSESGSAGEVVGDAAFPTPTLAAASTAFPPTPSPTPSPAATPSSTPPPAFTLSTETEPVEQSAAEEEAAEAPPPEPPLQEERQESIQPTQTLVSLSSPSRTATPAPSRTPPSSPTPAAPQAAAGSTTTSPLSPPEAAPASPVPADEAPPLAAPARLIAFGLVAMAVLLLFSVIVGSLLLRRRR